MRSAHAITHAPSPSLPCATTEFRMSSFSAAALRAKPLPSQILASISCWRGLRMIWSGSLPRSVSTQVRARTRAMMPSHLPTARRHSVRKRSGSCLRFRLGAGGSAGPAGPAARFMRRVCNGARQELLKLTTPGTTGLRGGLLTYHAAQAFRAMPPPPQRCYLRRERTRITGRLDGAVRQFVARRVLKGYAPLPVDVPLGDRDRTRSAVIALDVSHDGALLAAGGDAATVPIYDCRAVVAWGKVRMLRALVTVRATDAACRVQAAQCAGAAAQALPVCSAC